MGGERRSEIERKGSQQRVVKGITPMGNWGSVPLGSLGDIHLRVNPPEGEGAGVFLYQLP